MSRDRDQLLQRHFDGDADAGSLDETERAKLEALGELRATLKHTVTAESAGDIDVWAAVERRIAGGGAEVIPIGARIRRGLRAHRAVWFSTLAAAAAAMALLLGPWRGAAPVSNRCVIESLEVGAAVILAGDDDDPDDGTVLWLDDEED